MQYYVLLSDWTDRRNRQFIIWTLVDCDAWILCRCSDVFIGIYPDNGRSATDCFFINGTSVDALWSSPLLYLFDYLCILNIIIVMYYRSLRTTTVGVAFLIPGVIGLFGYFGWKRQEGEAAPRFPIEGIGSLLFTFRIDIFEWKKRNCIYKHYTDYVELSEYYYTKKRVAYSIQLFIKKTNLLQCLFVIFIYQ